MSAELKAIPPLSPAASSAEDISLLRLCTAGSVDDGKSTLIGRLLYDTGSLYDDHVAMLTKHAVDATTGALPFALLTDGLKAERQQGITIDVAYRYFSSAKRRFILADSPGHEQYTRNMATAASTANLALILVDATKGVLTQTRRHAFIASLMGVPRLVLVVNKMDLVGFSEEVFATIKREFSAFTAQLEVTEVRFVPISAAFGDNVLERSANMPWYEGEPLFQYLEEVYVAGDGNKVDFRFPVQYVIRTDRYRGYAGQICSGHIREGEEVVILPSNRKTRVKSIDVVKGGDRVESVEIAHAPLSVTVTLEDEIDVGRGDIIVRSHNIPRSYTSFESTVIWFSDRPMEVGKSYLAVLRGQESSVFINDLRYRIDVNTLSRNSAETLNLNEIGRVVCTSLKPLIFDSYRANRETGSFILVDPETKETVAACIFPEQSDQTAVRMPTPEQRNLHREASAVSEQERSQKLGYRPCTMWLTGLSGSGKSSLARSMERRLFDSGRMAYRLDGDNLRFGLNKDLGFSRAERSENIRRAAEVAKLLNEAGVDVICSFISPFGADRAEARRIIGDRFIEVFVSAPLELCEARDPHGLYAQARSGALAEFTGVSSPYEIPENPDLTIDTSSVDVDQGVEEILAKVFRERQI